MNLCTPGAWKYSFHRHLHAAKHSPPSSPLGVPFGLNRPIFRIMWLFQFFYSIDTTKPWKHQGPDLAIAAYMFFVQSICSRPKFSYIQTWRQNQKNDPKMMKISIFWKVVQSFKKNLWRPRCIKMRFRRRRRKRKWCEALSSIFPPGRPFGEVSSFFGKGSIFHFFTQPMYLSIQRMHFPILPGINILFWVPGYI